MIFCFTFESWIQGYRRIELLKFRKERMESNSLWPKWLPCYRSREGIQHLLSPHSHECTRLNSGQKGHKAGFDITPNLLNFQDIQSMSRVTAVFRSVLYLGRYIVQVGTLRGNRY